MKTVVLTASSCVKSSASAVEEDRYENRDSCYFPGCRKDANCNCEICLASINATLDLMPTSIHRNSLTKLSASRPTPKSPISFDPSVLSTPRSTSSRLMVSPPLNSSARTGFHEKMKRKKRDLGIGLTVMRVLMGLSLIFAADFGFSWAVSQFLIPEFSRDIVREAAEKSWGFQDLNGKLEFVGKELQSLTDGKVSNCVSNNSEWEVDQDNLLLNSRCTLYKSATEVVSVWGWPLQTAGLLTAEFSSRSFTILSGRITEWSNGKVSYSTREANCSWLLQKWSASTVQLDPNTRILEYTQSGVVENPKIVSAVLEFVKFRLSRQVKTMKQEFWLLSAFQDRYNGFAEESFKTPT